MKRGPRYCPGGAGERQRAPGACRRSRDRLPSITTRRSCPMRTLVAATFFAVVCALTVNAIPAGQEPKQPDKKKTQPKADPKAFRPDEATLRQIQEKTEQ